MSLSKLRGVVAACSLAVVALTPVAAHAIVVGSTTDINFSRGLTNFGYLGSAFILSDNGTAFPSPVSVSTTGTAAVATDFFGVSAFFDPPRNGMLFDGSLNYVGYPTPATVPFSVTPTFIALSVTGFDGVHYGYAQFAGTLLSSYAFETNPNVGIAPGAVISGVPEPESIALLGLGVVGLALARRRRA